MDKNLLELEMERRLSLFRKNLHYLRKKANKQTFDDVAEVTEISKDSLYKLEKGDDRYPNFKTVLKLSIYYRVSVDDLTDKDMEMEEVKSLSKIRYCSEEV